MSALYTIVTSLLLVLALPLLPFVAGRVRYRRRLLARLGVGLADRLATPASPGAGPCFWVQALSVGEVTSALPLVRTALIALQHSFARLPGLVADGRDMGTQVFPFAPLKVFLTADAAQRAERRHKQLISKGISANLESLRADLEARDARDQTRTAAPLKPSQDALLLDNSHLTIEQSVDQVLNWWQERQPFRPS